jgi:O-antigen ligase
MWLDNPMGVGANQYSLTANIGGYYERAGVAWNWSNRSTKVHNMYLLAGAETGWIGAFAFSLLIVWPIVTGLLFLLTNRADPRGDIVLGNVAAFIAFAISLGVVASNVRRSAVRRRAVGRGSEQVRPAKVPYGPVARKSHPLTVNLPSGHKT